MRPHDGTDRDEVSLRWLALDATHLPADTPIDDIVAKRLDGMSVRNVFRPAEVTRAMERLDVMRPLGEEMQFGALLGMPLNRSGANDRDLHPHMDDAARCRLLYEEAFGFDPAARVASVMEALTSRPSVRPPRVHGRDCNFGNVRWYDGGQGGLRTHCGNEFIGYLYDGAMFHLLETTKVYDHMSYFVVLQRPVVGGQLSVYDLLWEDYQNPDAPWDEARREGMAVDERPCVRFDPEPGEMIVFGGGWRWHRVDPVEGPVPRVTYGGFVGTSKDSQDLHAWP